MAMLSQMVRLRYIHIFMHLTFAYIVAHPSLAVDLLPALDALQTRLQALERENGVSRRRVTELELELEDCKIEVAKERTRVRERERERDEEAQIEWEREKERRVRGRMHEEENRYREVVEEKKGSPVLRYFHPMILLADMYNLSCSPRSPHFHTAHTSSTPHIRARLA